MFEDFADFLVYQLAGLSPANAGGQTLHFFVADTLKIFVIMTLMLLGVGFLRTWVSPGRIRAWLGRGGAFTYGVAALMGVISPFCSCSSIPLFLAFIRAGVPTGVAMTFLITSPMVNEVAAVLFGQVIGWHFMLAYIATGMVVGVLGGFLVDRLGLSRWIRQEEGAGAAVPQAVMYPDVSARLRAAWQETRETVAGIAHYVIIGVGVGAAIHGFVPQDWLTSNVGAGNMFAVPLAVLAGIPLYASCTGMVPVADALIGKGLPVGTTLAFVMSTSAISLPELMMLSRLMQPKLIAAFVAYLTVAFIVVGYGFNAVY